MTTASSTATAAVAATGPEPPRPTMAADSSGFAGHIAAALSTAADASAAGCGRETPAPPVRRLREEEPTQSGTTDALALFSLVEPWLNPAAQPLAADGPPARFTGSIGLDGGTCQAGGSAIRQGPAAPGAAPGTSAKATESTSPGNAADSRTAQLHLGPAAVAAAEVPSGLNSPSDLRLPPDHDGALGEVRAAPTSSGPEVPNPRSTKTLSVNWQPSPVIEVVPSPAKPASGVTARIERTPPPSLVATLTTNGSGIAAEESPAASTVAAVSVEIPVDIRAEGQTAPVFARGLGSAAEARFTEGERSEVPASGKWSGPTAGTGDAELSDGMRSATQPKQFAGLAQQNLPEPGAAFPAAAPELWRRGESRPVRAAGEAEVRAEATASLISLLPPELAGLHSLEEPVTPLARANAPVPADTLTASVLRQVTELRQTGATAMSVVLRPDAETQISLRLSLGGRGEVLVQARCEEGDAQALAANWGEIRHSLAQQGVRLGALEFSLGRGHDTFQPHAGNGGPSPDGQPSSQRHESPWRETLDDLSPAGSLAEPAARRAGQRPPAGRTRLLESWA